MCHWVISPCSITESYKQVWSDDDVGGDMCGEILLKSKSKFASLVKVLEDFVCLFQMSDCQIEHLMTELNYWHAYFRTT